MPVWLCKGALPWAQEEYGTVGDAVCTVQSLDGARQIARSAGMSAPENRELALISAKQACRSLKNAPFANREAGKIRDAESTGPASPSAVSYSDHP